MAQVKAYRLDVDTIESLQDVKVILNGLNLLTYSNVKDFEILKKYFTQEIIDEKNQQQDLKEEQEEYVEEDCDTCS
jgi:hypothetical protein